ncbi:MAG: DUF1015 family protein [Bacillota bacterium]
MLPTTGLGIMAWVIDAPPVIDGLVAEFRQVDYLYIADGHHRTAAAVQVGLLPPGTEPRLYRCGEEYQLLFSASFFPTGNCGSWPITGW